MQLAADLREMSRAVTHAEPSPKTLGRAVAQDSFAVLAVERARELARKWRVPGVNRALRMAETMAFGIEIGKEVKLGTGVYFVHTVGTVIGGTSIVGDRVVFMGNNTVGTARDDGYPVIEDDVVVGAGARILGSIRIGARSIIGANAVVLHDVPPDCVAVGVPAVVKPKPARASEASRAPRWR
jgi:serine O-acetyltransferase